MKTADLQNRFEGVMLGLAAGDCLGRPVEGHREVARSYLDEIRTSPPRLFYTDDTAMALAIADSLLASDGFSGSDLADRFVAEYQAAPHRGYGAGVVTLFDRVARGVAWDEAAQRQFDGQGSYGNGGAMRVAPVALWCYPDSALTASLAAETARVTHTHPIGVDGAVAQAVAVQAALTTETDQPFDTAGLLGRLSVLLTTDEFRSKFDTLGQALDQGDDEWAVRQLGHGVAADRSVLTALYCFLASDSFEETVIRAIGLGGDTDTIAAMAGAIAGARWGIEAIPPQWREVEEVDRILAAADELAARVTEAG